MDTKTFYKNLKRKDIRPLEEVVKILKKYHSLDIFVIGEAAKPHHHEEYETINLLLEGVNKTSYSLSIGEIEDMGAKIDVTRINTNKTTNDKSKYDSYVRDTIVNINYHRAKIRLFYTIKDLRISPKISL